MDAREKPAHCPEKNPKKNPGQDLDHDQMIRINMHKGTEMQMVITSPEK